MHRRDYRDERTAQLWAEFIEHEDPLSELAPLAFVSGDTLLDLGCGTGWHAVAAAQQVAKVVGIDISPSMLNIARNRSHRAGLNNITWIEADLATSDELIARTQPSKVLCWTVWRGISDIARRAIVNGLAQTSALVLVGDLMVPAEGLPICDLADFLADL